MWDPVPGDCTFRLTAAGDANIFNASASVSLNGQTRPPLRHADIVPGPATIEIGGVNQFWVIKPLLILTHDPDEPVTMEAWLENADGSTVQIPDGAGGTIEARCDWMIDEDAMSPLAIRISVTS
ncbi:MAG: hypothetical protein ACJ74H_08420 [Thermoanaerobaculia bacterium]